MRIGIVCYPTYGGSGAAATELGRRLAGRGHSVHLISLDRPFRLGSAPYQENFFLHEIASVQYPVLRSELYTLSAAVKMAQLVESERLDILHSHYAVPHAVSAMLARMILPSQTRVRLVTTLHGTDITLVGSNPAFAPVVELGLDRSDAVVTVSRWLADETERRFNLREPCRVIYNFIDLDTFRPLEHPCCARACLAPPGEKILIHISNFRPVKRTSDVIEVFARVTRTLPSVLLMVGDGPDQSTALQAARRLGIADRVRFLGQQADVATLLAMADIFLFPSEYESFGLAALEAMACQTPVICSDGGGLPEVVEHGRSGYLCPVGDIERMATHALEILNSPDKAQAMGKAGRQRALEVFRPEKALEAYENLYETLLATPANGEAHPS